MSLLVVLTLTWGEFSKHLFWKTISLLQYITQLKILREKNFFLSMDIYFPFAFSITLKYIS